MVHPCNIKWTLDYYLNPTRMLQQTCMRLPVNNWMQQAMFNMKSQIGHVRKIRTRHMHVSIIYSIGETCLTLALGLVHMGLSIIFELWMCQLQVDISNEWEGNRLL